MTSRVKEMKDTTFRVISSTGKAITVYCRGKGSGDTYYDWAIRGTARSWKYPKYAIDKAIKFLNGDVVKAEIAYKRKDQLEILIHSLSLARIIKSEWYDYEQRDEIELVPSN